MIFCECCGEMFFDPDRAKKHEAACRIELQAFTYKLRAILAAGSIADMVGKIERSDICNER